MEQQSLLVADTAPDVVYDVMVAALAPRPVAMIVTLGPTGVPSVAPYSFIMPGGSNPPSLVFSATLNEAGEPKQSLVNAQREGEFVVCGVSRMAFESWRQSPAGLEYLPSNQLKTPRLSIARFAFECRLERVIEHGTGPFAARYVIGEIVSMTLDSQASASARARAVELPGISRLGGEHYFDLAELETFTLE